MGSRNLRIEDVEEQGSEVGGYAWLNSEFAANLCYLTLSPILSSCQVACSVWKNSMTIAIGMLSWGSVGYPWMLYNQHGIGTPFRKATPVHSTDSP